MRPPIRRSCSPCSAGARSGGRSGTILEGEAGVNDPAGIALMLGMIELATHDDASFLVVVREFVVEMSVGVVLGVLGAFVLMPVLRRVRLGSEGLYPVLALVLAGALYGATSLAHGSGFLAVFILGLVLGDARTPYKGEIERFSGSLASLAELAVFVALGLTIDISALPGEVWLDGIVLALVLALLARPLVVLLTLGAARLSWAERAFITWSGLKGAVPILLAAFAVLGNVAGAERVYGVVFVVVLVSVVGQGTLVPFVARALAIAIRERPVATVGVVGQTRRRTASGVRVRGRRRLASGRPGDPGPPARRACVGHSRRPGRGGNQARRLARTASRRSRPAPGRRRRSRTARTTLRRRIRASDLNGVRFRRGCTTRGRLMQARER